MDTQLAATIIKGYLEGYLKNMGYFSDDTDHGRKLDLKSVTAAGDGIKVTYVVGEMFNVNDPSLRKAGRMAIEAMCEAQSGLNEVTITHEFVQ